ncbi:MAG TPA: hypothetical protein VLX58_08325 [Bryobacteraceae bacterium]|nr:hypothetical protein [Bryobacteraceae bacterium]
MKTNLTLILAFLFAATAMSAQVSENQLISIPPFKVTANSASVALVNSATKGNEPAAVQWTMTFSSNITSVIVQIGRVANSAHKTLSCSSFATGQSMTCLIDGLNQNAIPSGTLAYVTVQYAGPPAGQSTSITYSNPAASDPGGNAQSIDLYYTVSSQLAASAWVSQ